MTWRRHQKTLAFLFFATVLNYMDRQTLSITSPIIQKEFSLDNQQLGLLFSAFYVSYAVSVAFVGEVIDRISIRWAFAAIVIWWSGATMLTALSRSFPELFACRLLLGLGEAGLWPATARLISMFMAADEKTLANSFYMAGGSLGLVIIQPLMVWLTLKQGWRLGFLVVGGMSLFWIIAWLLWFRPPTENRLQHAFERTPSAWPTILRTPRFWGLMLASFCGNTCLYFLMNWLPTFLVEDRHFAFNLKFGGVVLIPYLGLDCGYFMSGFTAMRFSRSQSVLFVRRWSLALAACLMAVAVIATPFSKSDVMLMVLLFGTTLGMAAWNANYLSTVEELSPKKPAAVAGVVGSLGAVGGAISLWLIGWTSQITGSFTPVFVVVGLLITVATCGILLTPEPGMKELLNN